MEIVGQEAVFVGAHAEGAWSGLHFLSFEWSRDIEQTLRLRPLDGVISGIVLDAAGRPAAGADVEASVQQNLLHHPGHLVAGKARTDRNGRFEIHVASGLRYVVRARSDGVATAAASTFVPEGGSADVGVLRLPGAFAIEGRVLEDDGRPSERALVVVEEHRPHAGREPFFVARVHTDERGVFRALLPHPGHYDVVALPEGLPPSAVLRVAVDSRDREPRVVLRLPALATMRGQVVDVYGRALPGVKVAATAEDEPLHTASTSSDDEGRFVLGPLRRDGRYAISCLAPRASNELWYFAGSFAGSATGMRLVVPEDFLHPVSCVVRLLTGARGTPVPAFRGEVKGVNDGGTRRPVGTFRGRDGRALVKGLRRGARYECWISAPSFGLIVSPTFEARRDGQEIVLYAEGTAVLECGIEKDGAKEATFLLELASAGEEAPVLRRVRASPGRPVSWPVAAGARYSVRVRAIPGGDVVASRTVEPRADERIRVDLRIPSAPAAQDR